MRLGPFSPAGFQGRMPTSTGRRRLFRRDESDRRVRAEALLYQKDRITVSLNLNESWRVEAGRAILPTLVNDPPV
jgi:hypothetical protein